MGELYYSGPISSTVALLMALVLLFFLFRPSSHLGDRPPGPRGFPFFGNTFQTPSQHVATYLRRLHSQYGPFVYLNLNGQHTFSIGDLELATELLERRSALYSSRPTIPLLRYADPQGLFFSFAKPGENLFWGRKISTVIMKAVKAGHGESLMQVEAVATISKLVEDGGRDWYKHTSRLSARITVTAMYGVNSSESDGDAPEVARVLKLVDGLAEIATPFRSIINIIPFIDDLVPKFVPAPWRTSTEKWRKEDAEAWERLFRESVEGERARMSTWASRFVEYGKDRRLLLSTFASTRIALQSFVLACVAYPDWIEPAQKELDRVVGGDRLPNFKDRAALPFVEAVLREVLRWNPPVPTGGPHVSTADDTINYAGKEYFIPKGSTIFSAPYVIDRDPQHYELPDEFHPERFLDEEGQLKADYQTTAFGFGRRLCLGIPFAERILWIAIATMLWTFDIRKTTDPHTGKPFEYGVGDEAFDGNFVNAPIPFPVKFQPRSQRHVSVVRREWEDREKDISVLLPPLKE